MQTGQLSLILIIVIFLTSSCRKVGDGFVEGTITEEGTGLPYPDVVVYLQRSEHRYFSSSSGTDVILGTTTTDVTGHYYLPFRKKTGYGYSVLCQPKLFLNSNADRKYDQLTYKESKKNFSLYPAAYLKIRLKKNAYSTNYVSLNFEGRPDGPPGDIPEYYYPFDTILPVYAIVAAKSTTIKWYECTRNPATCAKHTDSFYLNKGDTLSYLISYN